ncbi:MAG: RHS repeat-associated core domain-containing protein, partial [Paludibacteraceae bacterium]|nr:RHS repeat-associated core domain-containing protein [Paludibacteraceae bacterium]
ITKESRGGKVTTYAFDGADRLTSKVCENIINYTYAYDAKGNLSKFTDNLSSQSCNYTYDELNRLAEWNAYGVDTANPVVTDKITYDESNNMVRKSSLGDMIFAYEDANHPHAVSSISGVPSSFPKDEQSITYTNFNKVESVSQGDKRYDITYGTEEQRIKSEYANAQGKTTRYYIGNYEEVTDPDGTVTKFCYLPGGAMMVEKNGEQTLYYNYTDRLVSIVATADADGNVIERYAYDPWGGRLNPDNWAEKDTRTSLFNNRGYTGHEHIDGLDLINMNGRMYDPLIGSFLSVDPFIQAPENWLNYNRYLYGFGNPMKYIDPSGNIGILAAIGIGAAVGAALGTGAGLWYGYNQGYTGQDLEKCAFLGLYIGAGVGALSGYFLQSVPSLIAAKTCLGWTMAGATIGESVGLVGGMAYGLANKAKGWDLAGCALTGSGIGLVAGAIIGAGCYGLYSWFVASSNAARASASASVMGTTIQCEAHSNVLKVQKRLTTLTGFENTPAYRNLTIDLEKSMEVAGVKNVQEAIEFVNYAQRINRPIIASAEIAAASACRRIAIVSAIIGTVGTGGILAGAGYGYYQLTNLWLKD